MKRHTRKIRLLINGMGGAGWIGGLYYKRNILFSLLCNESISEKVAITVVTEKENAHVFAPFSDSVDIKCVSYRSDRERQFKLTLCSLLSGTDVIYTHLGRRQMLLPSKGIYWIPDFQHNRLPTFFSKEEIDQRTRSFRVMADSASPLVLSSYDSLADFREFYSADKQNVYVVPFVSYIEPELAQLDEKMETRILEKYSLIGRKYVAVMNQFWQHKNHCVVFEAMRIYFARNPNSDVCFVFTGEMKDYRNPEYIENLKQVLKEPYISRHVKLLGFIDRTEQLAVMKNAQYMIQPSLFEGWGTVVEDAKVLDKTILLSDIPVHREQKNQKCMLFDPYDAVALSKLIEEENSKAHESDVKAGLADMYRRAAEYSKGFEQLLSDIQK